MKDQSTLLCPRLIRRRPSGSLLSHISPIYSSTRAVNAEFAPELALSPTKGLERGQGRGNGHGARIRPDAGAERDNHHRALAPLATS